MKMPTALVTGAAKRVGKHIAITLAQQGYDIILHYNQSQIAAETTMQQISEAGAKVFPLQADLADTNSLKAMLRHLDTYPLINVLINNASSFVKQNFLTTTIADWEQSININARAAFFLSQHVGKLMLQHKGNNLIVNISDLSGLQPWSDFSTHAVSKAALIHITKIAAAALAPNVRVNCIIPGIIMPPEKVPANWHKRIENIPLQREGTPENLSSMILHLIQNSFITGSVLKITGGE